MINYPKTLTINISEIQFNTLSKLQSRHIKIGDFIRKAIAEKIKKDCAKVKPKKEYCSF
jgi:hypothetical protein